jgi:ATP-dependent Clp protease, protease subunit
MADLHLYLYGEIGYTGITPEDVQSQINATEKPDKIYVHINSPGGSVYDGWTIGNILDRHENTEALIEGYCGSIATYIALKCKKVSMSETGRFMIHYSSAGIEGNKMALSKAVETLDRIDNDLIRTYEKKTGLSREFIDKMMKEEKEMTTAEAMSMRFVDGLMQPLKAVARFDIKTINKMAETKETAEKEIDNVLDKILAKAKTIYKDVFNPKNMAITLADGKKLFVESEDGELEGKRAFLANEDGTPTSTPAPVGNHNLVDGRVITVGDGGIITAVAEQADAMADPEKEEMKSTIAALKAQLDGMAQEKNALQTTVAKAEAQMGEVIAEINNLKKMTVGGSFKASKGYIKPEDKTTVKETTSTGLAGWAQQFDPRKK